MLGKIKKPTVKFSPKMAAKIRVFSWADLAGVCKKISPIACESEIVKMERLIIKHGLTVPILIKNKLCFRGQIKLVAAVRLKCKFIPVVLLDALSDDMRKAFIEADKYFGVNPRLPVGTISAEIRRLTKQIDVLKEFDDFVFDAQEISKVLEEMRKEDGK